MTPLKTLKELYYFKYDHFSYNEINTCLLRPHGHAATIGVDKNFICSHTATQQCCHDFKTLK